LLGEASVAIDGSKFKVVNNRDKNFTEAKMKRRLEQIDQSIAHYLSHLDTADRQGPTVPEVKTTRLKEKIAKLRQEIERLNALNARMMASEDKQISLTDPDARSMATSGKGSGIVGYNVQSAVDTTHHLIVAHDVTNVGSDRNQLSNMAEQARTEKGFEQEKPERCDRSCSDNLTRCNPQEPISVGQELAVLKIDRPHASSGI
jgi:hypothetical protein